MTTNNIKIVSTILARCVAARVSEDLAIATNDRVDLKERVVKRILEKEVLALQGLVLLGHQVLG